MNLPGEPGLPAVQKNRVFLVLFAFSVLLAALVLHWTALEKISKYPSGLQDHYGQDGYYYIYLGDKILTSVFAYGHGWIHSSLFYQPNWNTIGTIYLTSLCNFVWPFKTYYPVFFFIIYASLFMTLGSIYENTNGAILIFISGLFPYLFIPTKETFLLIGLILILLGVKKTTLRILILPGLALLLLGRPETLFIFALAFFFHYLIVNKGLRWSLLIFTLVVYFVFLRKYAYAISYPAQVLFEAAGVDYESVAGLPVKIQSLSTMEITYFFRCLAITGVVVKWPMNLMNLLLHKKFDLVDLGSTVPLVIQLCWGFAIVKSRVWQWSRMPPILSFATLFSCFYAWIYGALFFFQPARQILFPMAVWIAVLALEGELKFPGDPGKAPSL